VLVTVVDSKLELRVVEEAEIGVDLLTTNKLELWIGEEVDWLIAKEKLWGKNHRARARALWSPEENFRSRGRGRKSNLRSRGWSREGNLRARWRIFCRQVRWS
jgi:hypothetical protein